MTRRAFKMRLFKGFEQEYQKRHDEIWPELSALLKEAGISNYSIFLDPESLTLFGIMDVSDHEAQSKLSDHPVMKRWWNYMKDIMETNPDHSPVSTPLTEVFHLD
jgi:L-rhamnose mutarotase